MAPPRIDGFLTKIPSQGEQGARLKWFYLDDSSDSVIAPTGLSGLTFIFNPSDISVSAANTDAATFTGSTPTQDTDGGYYIDVNMANLAPTGQWYISTTFTWEGVTRTNYLVFQVVSAGATASGGSSLYCTVDDVKRYLFRNVQEIDHNTVLSKVDVERIILAQMQVIDDYTQRSWRLQSETDELEDVTFADKWRWHGDYIMTFTTTFSPIRSITALSVNQGGQDISILGTGPDRANDKWYVHLRNGTVYIIGSQVPSVIRLGAKISYTWGETVVPESVRNACYMLASAEILESEQYAVALPEESATAGTVADKVSRWEAKAYKRLDQVKDLVYSASGG